jgi:UDP-N-acetylmuramyl pentapeptide phosphotransferase/UDP-N-acetylglucosamine-1-phosphate transferase
MSIFSSIAWFAAVAVVSWLAGFPLRRGLARAGVMDVPKTYSSHDRPVPRGGGLLVVAAFFLWYSLGGPGALPAIGWAALGVAAVAAISFRDDIRHQSRRLRFAIYTVAAAVFVLALRDHPAFAAWGPFWLFAPWLWLWVAGYANAFNFIDGIDGLAGTQAVAALLFGAALCTASGGDAAAVAGLVGLQLVLAGAMAGFLGHNLPRARLFLGDVGSIATGFLLAALAVIAAVSLGWQTGVAMASLHLGPTLDTGITLLRRIIQGKPVYDRHREFFFHRAIRSGRSHLSVTLTQLAIQVLGGSLVLRAASPAGLWSAIGATVAAWLAYFAWCEWRFRHRAAPTHPRRAAP